MCLWCRLLDICCYFGHGISIVIAVKAQCFDVSTVGIEQFSIGTNRGQSESESRLDYIVSFVIEFYYYYLLFVCSYVLINFLYCAHCPHTLHIRMHEQPKPNRNQTITKTYTYFVRLPIFYDTSESNIYKQIAQPQYPQPLNKQQKIIYYIKFFIFFCLST